MMLVGWEVVMLHMNAIEGVGCERERQVHAG